MKFQIKSLSGELEEDQKKFLRKRILWLEKHLPESSVLTVGVKQHITKKSNQAYEIILHLTLQNVKKPLYVRTFANTLADTIAKAEDKIQRQVVRIKERKKGIRFKMPSIKLPKIRFRKRAK
ncbi:MAG: hypothetical protein BWY43_00454 [candidate division WS2 bacterium ADurb.Bin280]|uniref:Sigma 54 modulation protein / S30EA ribosomal protein n=1 Tax=candidate division WS2 bacterium ADurb.Bin280 TaxID=1852829 RepID=A0A1V5SEC0_9BACT|nr:MAG: hypothetical protein BWY43_00454 [candidate division WS2 bacterium ADurb.Bin280]